ncbi:hypothetical protein QUB75_02560 [Microcoleus sp. K1-B6]|uniref:hypothetical protein n=1 Tax=unclassified Microcoleus TaxID=2642155 RepID=UPI002FD0F6CD
MTGFLDVERSSNLVISLWIYQWVAFFHLKISNLKSQIGRSSNLVISLRIYQWVAFFHLKSQISNLKSIDRSLCCVL